MSDTNGDDFELMRLRLLAEMDEKFNDLIKELNEHGTEFSRLNVSALKKDIENMREKTKNEFEEIWSWTKSQLVTIETGQQLLYNPKNGLLTQALRKVNEAIKMATDAAACTVEARKASEEAKVYVRTNIFVTAAMFLGIVITVVGSYFTFISKTKEDIANQQEMINALQSKLIQDAANQAELIGCLNSIKKSLLERRVE